LINTWMLDQTLFDLSSMAEHSIDLYLQGLQARAASGTH
jgi:hypothetical protein